LIIIRGITGSGKSTLGRKLLVEYGGRVQAEADHFMVDEFGNYAFNPKKLSYAHESCAAIVDQAMESNENVIVVSNTSTTYWEMYNYVVKALKYGYDIEFVEPTTEWRYNAEILFEKSQHHVPLSTIRFQLENFFKHPTLPVDLMIPKILATFGSRFQPTPTQYLQGFHFHPTYNIHYYGLLSTDPRLSLFITQLKSHLTDLYPQYNFFRMVRDGSPLEDVTDLYHITLTQATENDKLTPETGEAFLKRLNKLLEDGEEPQFLGVGKLEDERHNVAYYVLIEWDGVHRLREAIGWKLRLNLHITLGFDKEDVYSPKTRDTLLQWDENKSQFV